MERDEVKRIQKNEDRQIKGQANKSIGRMPWYQEPMKDVTSCEKLWGDANNPRSTDVRMRELTQNKKLGIIT